MHAKRFRIRLSIWWDCFGQNEKTRDICSQGRTGRLSYVTKQLSSNNGLCIYCKSAFKKDQVKIGTLTFMLVYCLGDGRRGAAKIAGYAK